MSIPVRPLFTIVLSIGLVGWGYWIASNQPVGNEMKPNGSTSPISNDQLPNYSIELLRTFTAEHSDESLPANVGEFATNENLMSDRASLQILFEGDVLFESSQPVEPNQQILIENIPGVRTGSNEIFVLARLKPAMNPQTLHAMVARVRVGERIISESVYTNHAGSSLVYGTLVFDGGTADEK